MLFSKRPFLSPAFGWFFLCAGVALQVLVGCQPIPNDATQSVSAAPFSAQAASQTPSTFKQTGYASWYGKRFHGRRTASGAVYDMHALTAAHRTLPLNSYVRVTNLENGKQVIVLINDRGPFGIFRRRRIIDLSYAAAKALDMHLKGKVKVVIEAITPEEAKQKVQKL